MRNFAPLAAGILIGVVATAAAGQLASGRGGYVIERDAMVAREEPGPHSGGGRTVGYSFFSGTRGLKLVFRRRVLQPGSGIGYHEQKEDEIFEHHDRIGTGPELFGAISSFGRFVPSTNLLNPLSKTSFVQTKAEFLISLRRWPQLVAH